MTGELNNTGILSQIAVRNIGKIQGVPWYMHQALNISFGGHRGIIFFSLVPTCTEKHFNA